MKRFFAIAALMLGSPAFAMDTSASLPAIRCTADMSLESIAEPWADNTATYADGEVRIVLLFHVGLHEYQLAILHPPRTELGTRQCHLIAPAEDRGYAQMDFDRHRASYDAERGLIIQMPVQVDDSGEPGEGWSDYYININQQTGEVRYQGFS